MRLPDEIVMVRCPADERVPYESWLSGPIVETIAIGLTHALHIIRPLEYKPNGEDWRLYDGCPRIIARETYGRYEMEWLDTWPRRERAIIV